MKLIKKIDKFLIDNCEELFNITVAITIISSLLFLIANLQEICSILF